MLLLENSIWLSFIFNALRSRHAQRALLGYHYHPLSYRHVEELLEERGVPVHHATNQRWVVKYSPQLEEAFHRRKRPVWVSRRMDETYIEVKGAWRYLSTGFPGENVKFCTAGSPPCSR